VIGQVALKKTLSVAIYNHYKRLEHNLEESMDYNATVLSKSYGGYTKIHKGKPMNYYNQKQTSTQTVENSLEDKLTIEKSNVLLLGPTGCGKLEI
jgi:ATP-dependent Clp protease ATP-binding subunit ClpX